ncbi:molybdopterin-containing oxidoreductase family protein [Miniphocaeibacter massiliensis]|uniref:molybdopterin-containing oxidoreductase family protein n=1 Tax=Miniphocaeibacter massiliensis TaxID=2041841 RepID=UPI000C1C0C50|nr:molybdopterin-dependent oxidoreductase [Miniphocaeibacter massiliensis]
MYKKNITCGLCPSGCHVDGIFEDQKLISIEKSKTQNNNICLRGIHSPDVIYSKDRLTKPLIRNGKKGSFSFREASWEEALDYAAESFLKIKDKYGAKSLISHIGRGGFDNVTDFFATNTLPFKKSVPSFFEPLGSPNHATVSSLCYVSFGVFAPFTTFGIYGANISPDIENSNLVLVWGTNPYNSSPPINVKRLRKAKENGAKIIAIDHYSTEVFNLADNGIIIRSGTDGLFILGLIKYIVERELYNKNFVENFTHGFEDLIDYIKNIDYSYIEKTTGVSYETLKGLAKQLANTTPASVLTYTGLEYSNSGVQSIRALYSLFAITGNIDIKGGLLVEKNKSDVNLYYKVPKFEDKRIGAEKYPLFNDLLSQSQFMEFPNAVLNSKPYKIAGLFNIGSVISVNYPNSKLYQKALSELEFFVTVDRFKTKDSDYADVIFPATTYFENYGFQLYNNRIEVKNRTIEPIGEAKSNIYVLHEIAKRLGYGEMYPKNDKDILVKAFKDKPEIYKALTEKGVYFYPKAEKIYKKFEKGLLRDDNKPGFPTRTGKFEFRSSLLEEYGYEPLPKYKEAMEGSIYNTADIESYPLILNTGARIKNTFRTQHLNIDSLVKYQPYPYAIINPKDAEKRNISTNDKVSISTKRGVVEFFAKISDDILEGEVELNVGGGSKYQHKNWANANANILTDSNNVDEISGFPCFKTLLCEITKID